MFRLGIKISAFVQNIQRQKWLGARIESLNTSSSIQGGQLYYYFTLFVIDYLDTQIYPRIVPKGKMIHYYDPPAYLFMVLHVVNEGMNSLGPNIQNRQYIRFQMISRSKKFFHRNLQMFK